MFLEKIQARILSDAQIEKVLMTWRGKGDKVVFTNGCFDILHYGHVHYLAQARDLGQRLVVGLNSDDSVRRLKGNGRPIQNERTRSYVMASLECVDAVVIFSDETPLSLIKLIQPDVLVKGGDWEPSQIVGAGLVLASGGKVISLPYVAGFSTTDIETKIISGS